MSANLMISLCLNSGTVSRYTKPSLLSNNYIISPVLFDLRDGTPPEEFVSFYDVKDINEEERFSSAVSYLNNFTPKQNGVIILLDIVESLAEVNDEEDDIISFTEQNLPHCGLKYLTTNLSKVQEAKTTLSYLASQRFKLIKDISNFENKLVIAENL